MKKIVSTPNAPAAPALLSQAVLDSSQYCLELSGQIGLDPHTGKLVEGGIAQQTKQAFKNIEAILMDIGWTMDNVTKVRLYFTDMADYQAVNDVYTTFFRSDPPTCVALGVKALPLGAAIEIECTATGDTVK